LQGEAEAALKAFTALAEMGGKDWADRAWFQIGQVQAGAGRSEEAAEAFAKVERVAPQSPLVAEARLGRAEVLARLGRRDEALPLLRALAAEAPQNLAARAAFALGTAELEAGDATAALATLDDATKRFARTPMAAALTFRAAEAALKLGRGDDARARFLRAAEADPNDPWADDALARAARLALDQRDFEAAARLAAGFASRFPNSPLRADARLVAARAALALGKPKEAIATLTASLAGDKPGPATAEAQRYYLGLAYRADGQAAKASELLDALAQTPAAPIAADAQFLVGQGHVDAKRFAEAVGPLERYLAAKPDGDVADFALAHLVQARLELSEPDAALKALEQLAAKFPKSKALPVSRLRVAEAALVAKQYDRAAEQFTKAEAEAAEPAVRGRAQLGLGWALLDGGRPLDAAHAFGRFVDARPDDPLAPEASLARGRAFEAAGKAEDALSTYAHTSETYPKSDAAPLAAVARARYKARLKRPAEAATAYEAFLKDFPDYAPKDGAPGRDAVLAELGWALTDAEKPEQADAAFTRLLSEFPDSPFAADARFNLAESAHQAKDHEEVIKLLTPLVAEGSKASPRLLQSGLYRLGRTQAERKDWPAATKTLDRLLAEFPDGSFRREAKLLRAEVALESGDAGAADSLLSALHSEPADPNDPEGFALAVRRRRVQSLLGLKKWADVVAAADALKADAPSDPLAAEVDYARGRALQQLARWDDARAAYQAVIDARKGGDLVARAQLMIGETYYHQKDYREAIRQFLKVDILYDAPRWQAAALLETGKAYEQLSQWADAAESYERLRAKFPDDPAAMDAKARLDGVKKHLDGPGGAKADAGTD
jgi:TolA-binding protein